jgi:hypothetical protein
MEERYKRGEKGVASLIGYGVPHFPAPWKRAKVRGRKMMA